MRSPFHFSLTICGFAVLSMAPALEAQTAQLPTQSAALVYSDIGPATLLPLLRPIKGEPFSATFTLETKQLLADGTTISRTRTGKVARDGVGRTCNETTMARFPESDGRTLTTINIHDASNGTSIVLMPDTHTARRMSGTPISTEDHAARLAEAQSRMAARATAATPDPSTLLPAVVRSRPTVEKVDLGDDVIDGVPVKHYQQTETIAAGQIGNDQALVITSEYWYATKLGLNLKAIRNDPRLGNSTLTLENVETGEPPAALFEIPPDYRVVDAPMGRMVAPTLHGAPAATTSDTRPQ